MSRSSAVIPLMLVLVGVAFPASGEFPEYDARIREEEILCPAPAPAPRINGPTVYGARSGKQFIYRIPTQGERPIEFSIEGLPASLKLNSEEGTLRGVTPSEKGTYEMTFSASNAHGQDSRKFNLVVGDTLALTPPTGWNHWGGHASNVSAGTIRAAADMLVERGLADVGFQYVGIDDCWMRMPPSMQKFELENPESNRAHKHRGMSYDRVAGKPRDEEGNILPNQLFPDMKGLVDHIHSYGLKAGIYSSPGPKTGQFFAGSYEHEQQDAQQYAAWGFDLLKYDLCSGIKLVDKAMKEPGYQRSDFWKPMIESLNATDRDIVFNLCQYGIGKPWVWGPEIKANTWRIGGDLNHKVHKYFDQGLRIATDLREYNKPGQWSDPDYMYLGNQVQSLTNHFVKATPTGLTTNQQYSTSRCGPWSVRLLLSPPTSSMSRTSR